MFVLFFSLENLPMEYLWLQSNKLSGSMNLRDVGNKLRYLDISDNFFDGTLNFPAKSEKLSRLETVFADRNAFTGIHCFDVWKQTLISKNCTQGLI